jgi:putative membrane protein
MMRHLLLLAGIAVLAAAWLGPLPELADSAFARHMIVHVAVVAVAAPLVSIWFAAVPGLMRRMPRSLVSPIPASAFELVVVWAWHLPLLHELARLYPIAWAAEQASFLIAGVLLWTSALRPVSAGDGGDGSGILALLLTSMHMVLLGTLLTLAPRPLYTHGIASLSDVYAHLAGQHVGGMLMLIGGGLPYLAGGLYLVDRLLRKPPIASDPAGVTPTGGAQ